MEVETLNKLYKEYLEKVMDIKYKKLDIQRVSRRIDSEFYLKRKDNGSSNGEKYNEIMELENGNFLCYRKDNDEYVFINNEGVVLKRINGVSVCKFCDGIARVVSRKKPYLCGYVDLDGHFITDIKWGFSSRDFSCGRAVVEGTGKDDTGMAGYYGYIDKSGNVVIPFRSTQAYSFSDDVCCIEETGKKVFLDKDGNELFKSDSVSSFFNNGLVMLEGNNGKYGFKNKKGEIAIKPRFQSVTNFENGLSKTNNGYINIKGDYVRVGSFDDGIKYIKGLLKPIFYNSTMGTYDKLDCIPYRDYDDYLVGVHSSEVVIYCKEKGIYTHTGIRYQTGNIKCLRKSNLLMINDKTFFLKPSGCVSLSTVLNVSDICSLKDDSDVISFDEFKAKDELSLDVKCDNKTNNLNEQNNNRQEKIEQLESLKNSLVKLEKSNYKRSVASSDLFSVVDDHLEVNKEYLNKLRFLDLSCIDFSNVKVSGLDFSESNASINPQTVYQRNMSNGKYDGLDFNSKDFSGVNVIGSTFDNCNMDFTLMDGAIKEDVVEEEEFIL